MNEVDKVRISKRFSMILRHTASETPGLEIRPDGFVALRSILAIPVFAKNRVTVDFVKTMVAKDEKTRFSLIEESGELFIRANQGHSTKVAELLNTDEVLTEIRAAGEIPKAVHGTDKQAWDRFIKHEGLKPMKRAFIHFAPDVVGEDDVRSGMRKSSSVYIYIDTAKAMRDGIKFYRSENNVILSTGLNGVISPAYFAKVEDVRTGGVLFTNTGT